jgi:hypothetical protein
MSTRAERKKQRYAEDPEYRGQVLAANHRYSTAHRVVEMGSGALQ